MGLAVESSGALAEYSRQRGIYAEVRLEGGRRAVTRKSVSRMAASAERRPKKRDCGPLNIRGAPKTTFTGAYQLNLPYSTTISWKIPKESLGQPTYPTDEGRPRAECRVLHCLTRDFLERLASALPDLKAAAQKRGHQGLTSPHDRRDCRSLASFYEHQALVKVHGTSARGLHR